MVRKAYLFNNVKKFFTHIMTLECGLCETQGMSNCMFQHLVGRDHRQKFVEHLYPNDPSKLSLTQVCLYNFSYLLFDVIYRSDFSLNC